MKPTPIHLEQLDRQLLEAEAARVGSTLSAVVRRLIRENLRKEAAKEVAR
jgi:hypothetical protein